MNRFLLALCLVFLAVPVVRAEPLPRVIEVSAIAEKSVDPDMVSLNVEVWSKGNTAKLAQSLNAAEYAKLKKTFELFKIKKEDISTESYSVNPEYVWDTRSSQNKLVGFRANQTLRVTVHKLDEAGSFLDKVTTSEKKNDAGVNVNNIIWDSSKKADAEIAGLSDAVKLARKKADEIALAAGVKIKAVQRLSHHAAYDAPTTSKYLGLKTRGAEAMAEMAAPTILNEGQIKIRVHVSAEFEIM